jgi:hypothetical protein
MLNGANGFNPYAFAAHYNMMQYAAMAAAASGGNTTHAGNATPGNSAATNSIGSGTIAEPCINSSSQVAALKTTSVSSEEDEEV